MLDPLACRERTHRLCESCNLGASTASPDALLVCSPEHLLYFANLLVQPASLNAKSISYLLIHGDGATTLITDNWLGPPPEGAVDEVLVVEWYTGKRAPRDRHETVAGVVAGRLKKMGVKILGAEAGFAPQLAVEAVPGRVNIAGTIAALREIKQPDEIQAIRAAIAVAEAAHRVSRDCVQPGVREIDVHAAMVEAATRSLGQPFLMMGDIASGERAVSGGGPPTTRQLREEDLVILDLFPLVNGYRGDITNTLSVGRKPTAAQEDAFGLVKEALEAGEAALGPAAPVAEVFREMDGVFRGAGKGWSLIHHGGHGIGLGHPEPPHLVPESDRRLTEGMVITLEPGLYDESFGGLRLEHDYLITASGCERLSNHVLGL